MLEWKSCVTSENSVSDQKIWESTCEKYRVVLSHIRYGGGELPDVWYAMQLNEAKIPSWEIISRHRKQGPAQKACNKLHKERKNAIAKLERLEKQKRKRSK